MAHFAKLDDNNVVIAVNVVGDSDCLLDGVEDEATGISFLTSLTGYAGVGSIWDEANNIFIHPRPYASWTLNTTTATWEPPIDYPTNSLRMEWDEENQQWIED